MVFEGSGGKYSRKYVKIPVDVLRHEIIPKAADECAKERAEKALTPQQYRDCLKRKIRELIKQYNE